VVFEKRMAEKRLDAVNGIPIKKGQQAVWWGLTDQLYDISKWAQGVASPCRDVALWQSEKKAGYV